MKMGLANFADFTSNWLPWQRLFDYLKTNVRLINSGAKLVKLAYPTFNHCTGIPKQIGTSQRRFKKLK